MAARLAFSTFRPTVRSMTPLRIQSIQQTFLSSPHYAVVGASKNPNKFGTKVLKWYQARNKSVTPVHPMEKELEGLGTVSSIDELASPSETSISIITPASITLGILKKAKELNVPALWLQPGAEDDEVVSYINENGLEDRVIYGGPCILVDGDGILESLNVKSSL